MHLIGVDPAYSDGPSIEARTLRVAAAFREQDEARRARLDYVVKVLAKCRFCGAELTDVTLAKTPGVCSRAHCRKEAGLTGRGGA